MLMNREIKFRVWNKSKNQFILPKFIEDIIFSATKSVIGCDNSEEFVFQQFTGLKDRSGLEMYEGDIVEFVSGVICGTAGVIKWYFTGYIIEYKYGINTCHAYLSPSSMRVKGNIFENGDLLN